MCKYWLIQQSEMATGLEVCTPGRPIQEPSASKTTPLLSKIPRGGPGKQIAVEDRKSKVEARTAQS